MKKFLHFSIALTRKLKAPVLTHTSHILTLPVRTMAYTRRILTLTLRTLTLKPSVLMLTARTVTLTAIVLALTAPITAQAQGPDTAQRVIADRRNNPRQQQKPYVIFISADGFRYDLAERYNAKNLLALSKAGVRAEAMRPSYPSVTFPNHYSLATGMYPSHHGIVDNTFYDPKRNQEYRIANRNAVEDGSWYGGTPIWVLAEQQEMLSASLFWVGSEASIQSVRPTYYYRFNDKMPIDARLQTLKQWLTLPEDRRPHMITFYLSNVDHAEHYHGPVSKETEEAVQIVDDCIGRMKNMLDSLNLPINYIFVSDHGMADVDTTKGIDLPAAIDTTKFRVAVNETMLHLYAKDKNDIAATYAAFKTDSSRFNTYLPTEVPARWHYAARDDRYNRIGDIILVCKPPKVFNVSHRHIIPGMHGYDNALRDMQATFYCWGPAFKSQLTIPVFDNVNVYPLITQILGLPIPYGIDGDPKVLRGILK